ncbi:hydrogenase maturation peptidase HycI [Bisgaard Taxon 10/6]|uniref:Hydrogenase maturation peptidase HycI n=1 Tax=Exercitatus varius TaxID=67857 RepID=A0ABT6ERD5_9PAST|nr:hydrogenase maturation peptidase HycI [Exercitatus varius]MDG2938689.1 hydrogenase maturation peptidase HycI [Exercitatus varius]MDG2946109.1 hydrogenase maturation peptidase HycI [Exercitatus varius]MDG2957908.1 hydrogenase maturation peptidase HycI [Exercitatus varius]QOF68517.1 hydrogenase maturation peptidase HycI [Actinobacillus sp. GY-402]
MAAKNVVLTVGNSMMGDDGAGPLLYQLLRDNPIDGWEAVDGGSAPENAVHVVRALQPEKLLIVDATDMELEAGALKIVDKTLIGEMFFMSTHNMPLNFLIEQLEQDIPHIIFVGVQPDLVSFMFPISEKVKSAVENLYVLLKENRLHEIESL